MVKSADFKKMRSELAAFDKEREQIIRQGRDVLKQSKAAIYALHRDNVKSAQTGLKSAKLLVAKLNAKVKAKPELAIGAYNEALEEYAEACCYAEFVKSGSFPAPTTISVPTNIYLAGVCDAIGELTRKAISDLVDGKTETAVNVRALTRAIHAELLLFDWPNSSLRKKFDSIKYVLDKLNDALLHTNL